MSPGRNTTESISGGKPKPYVFRRSGTRSVSLKTTTSGTSTYHLPVTMLTESPGSSVKTTSASGRTSARTCTGAQTTTGFQQYSHSASTT